MGWKVREYRWQTRKPNSKFLVEVCDAISWDFSTCTLKFLSVKACQCIQYNFEFIKSALHKYAILAWRLDISVNFIVLSIILHPTLLLWQIPFLSDKTWLRYLHISSLCNRKLRSFGPFITYDSAFLRTLSREWWLQAPIFMSGRSEILGLSTYNDTKQISSKSKKGENDRKEKKRE